MARRKKGNRRKRRRRLLEHFPEVPSSLQVFYDIPNAGHGTPISVPTMAQTFIIAKKIQNELEIHPHNAMPSKLRQKSRSKRALRNLRMALDFSMLQHSSAAKIQTKFRRFVSRKKRFAARKLSYWFWKTMEKWKYRIKKADMCRKRFKERQFVKVLQKWHVWAYQSCEIKRRQAKIFAGIEEKTFLEWVKWTKAFVKRKKEFMARRRRRCLGNYCSRMYMYAQKQRKIKEFFMKQLIGFKRQYFESCKTYAKLSSSAKVIQCAFRCYRARRRLYVLRRLKIAKETCARSLKISIYRVKRWIEDRAAKNIQRVARGHLGRVRASYVLLQQHENERVRKNTESLVVEDAGRNAAKLCLRRIKAMGRFGGKRKYKDLYKRMSELKKTAKKLANAPASEDDYNHGALESLKKLSPSARRYACSKHAFSLFDPAQVGKIPASFVEQLLQEARIPMSKDEQRVFVRVLPRIDGFIYMSDFRKWSRKGEIHNSVGQEDDHRKYLSGTLSFANHFFQDVELQARHLKRELVGTPYDELAARLLIIEAQCLAQIEARETFRVCSPANFTCPRCHRDFLLGNHLLMHLGIKDNTSARALASDKELADGLVAKSSECQPRSLQRLFEMNYGNCLSEQVLKGV